MARFVLIDETIVDRGFWVLISGIDLELFKKNPVMFWMHQRSKSWDSKEEQKLPIGRWDDIKIEIIKGVKSITAEAIFDEEDDFALKIKKKVDNNFLRMASAGLIPKKISQEKKHIKQGQTRATLVASVMQEASIVDIGGNRNAVRLYDEDGEVVNLSDGQTPIIPTLNKQKEDNMKSLALALGLKKDAIEAEILGKVEELKASEKANKELAVSLQANRVAELLKSEAIPPDKKETIEKLAKTDFNLAKDTVAILEAKDANGAGEERLSSIIDKTKTPKGEVKKWDDYSDKELQELRSNKIDDYIKLYSSEFGYEPIMN